jgi:hypothetical protein
MTREELTDIARLEELQNFLSGGASSRPTIVGRTSTEERLPIMDGCRLLPGCANDQGATAENVAPTSGDAK